jgi:tetratricopeptide (TPR) repeat protein
MSNYRLFGRKRKQSATQWLEQGIAAYQEGQYQVALQSLDEALRSDAGLAQAWYFKAASLGKLNRRQEEIRAWTEYLKSKPDDVNAWVAKANAHFQLQTPVGHSEALRCVNRALQLDPDNAQVKLMKRLFQGDQDALAPLTHDMVRNYNAKAKSLLQAGRAEEAMNFADQVLLVDAESVEGLNNKAFALLLLERFQEALSFLDRAIARDPTVEALWYNKAGALARLNRPEDALRMYEKVLELNPRSASAWKHKALMLNRLGRDEEALRCFDVLIEMNPDDDDAWYNKGIVMANLGHPDCMDCFLRALRINPQNEGVRQIFADLEKRG